MGQCQEFGVEVQHGCGQAMRAQPDHCRCPGCGAVCEGRFNGCPAVWLTPSPAAVSPPGEGAGPVRVDDAVPVAVVEAHPGDEVQPPDEQGSEPVTARGGWSWPGPREWLVRTLGLTGVAGAFGGRRRRDAATAVAVLVLGVGAWVLMSMLDRPTTVSTAAATRVTTSVVAPTTTSSTALTGSPEPAAAGAPPGTVGLAAAAPSGAPDVPAATGPPTRRARREAVSRPAKRSASLTRRRLAAPPAGSPTAAPVTPTTGPPPTVVRPPADPGCPGRAGGCPPPG